MTIVDQFIIDHHNRETIVQISKDLGVSPDLVSSRIKALIKPPKVYDTPLSLDKEMKGLINLIETYKTGWAVDIAKQKLIKLQNMY
jgi:hypothetical protein